MSGGWWRRLSWAAVLLAAFAGCRGPAPGKVPPSNDHWLVVWAEDVDRSHSDFLAVLAEDGTVVRTIPVKSSGNGPQGLNSELRRDRRVFATGGLTNRTFVFDLRDPRQGTLVAIDDPGTSRILAGPRGVATVPGGRALVACADEIGYRGAPREVLRSPGGLRVLDDGGRFVSDVPARDRAARGFIVAPAGIAVQPALRRVVTASQGHSVTPTAQGEPVAGITVQLWSLSGPTFEKNLVLPDGDRGDENLGPRTPVFLHRKPALVVNANEGGGIYVSDTMDLPEPVFRLVADLGARARPDGAAVTPDDRFYVTALAGSGRVVSLALGNLHTAREVSSVALDGASSDGAAPLAMSLDGTRVAVSDGRRVRLLRLDPTGHLRTDGSFRDEGSGEPGVDFGRAAWPHGRTGAARPRALLFVSPGE
jgi:DNA-binding beta-propeller fold protein YncE